MMILPDNIHLYNEVYFGLCFAHAVKLVISEDAQISMKLEESQEDCTCDLCEEASSIESAISRKNKVVWTRQMVEELPEEIELYQYNRYMPKKKRWSLIKVNSSPFGNYYQIKGNYNSYYLHCGDTISTMRWLNDNQIVRAEDIKE